MAARNYFDTYQTGAYYSAPLGGAFVSILNDVKQGTQIYQRIGDAIWITRMDVKVWYTEIGPEDLNDFGAVAQDLCRTAIVYDAGTYPEGEPEPFEDVFIPSENNDPDPGSVLSEQNYKTQERYTILLDISCPNGLSQTLQAADYSIMERHKEPFINRVLEFPEPLKTMFSGSSEDEGDGTDISSGGIAIYLADLNVNYGSNNQLGIYTRIYYYDEK